MKKETDLGGVKAIAKALLMTAVNQTPYSPMLVQHPFTSTGLIPFPTEMNKGFQPVDITLNEDNLKIWRESVSQIIDETENPYHIYMLLNPPYALTFLKLASPYLSRKDFSEILASAWINCEAPHNDPELNKADLTLATESVQNNTSFEENEAEYKDISEQIEQLGSRIIAINESLARDNSRKDRLQRIQEIIAQRRIDSDTYDDSIVRQMIECIEVFKDGTLLIHFGVGYEIEEHI